MHYLIDIKVKAKNIKKIDLDKIEKILINDELIKKLLNYDEKIEIVIGEKIVFIKFSKNVKKVLSIYTDEISTKNFIKDLERKYKFKENIDIKKHYLVLKKEMKHIKKGEVEEAYRNYKLAKERLKEIILEKENLNKKEKEILKMIEKHWSYYYEGELIEKIEKAIERQKDYLLYTGGGLSTVD